MIGILILTGIAFLFSILLVFVDTLKNKSSALKEVLDLLPGLNCGACGFGNCEGMAEHILKEKDSYKRCRPLRGEKKEKLEVYLSKQKF